MKKIITTAILAVVIAGIFLSNIALAGDDDNDDDNGAGTQINTITATIDSNTQTGVVIGPVSAKMFVMIFKTSSDYDGDATFEAQLEDNSWIAIGPGQTGGATVVNGMDSLAAADYKLPFMIRVVVTTQATQGQSIAQIHFLDGLAVSDDDEDDDNNDDE